jgi:hypothetical protein
MRFPALIASPAPSTRNPNRSTPAAPTDRVEEKTAGRALLHPGCLGHLIIKREPCPLSRVPPVSGSAQRGASAFASGLGPRNKGLAGWTVEGTWEWLHPGRWHVSWLRLEKIRRNGCAEWAEGAAAGTWWEGRAVGWRTGLDVLVFDFADSPLCPAHARHVRPGADLYVVRQGR